MCLAFFQLSVNLSWTANAAIGTDWDPVLEEPLGEVFLSVYDSSTGASYTRDLGVNVAFTALDFATYSFAPDPLYISTFGAANPTNLRYAVTAIVGDLFGEQKVWTTSSAGSVSFVTDANVTLQAILDGVGAYVSGVNSSIPSTDVAEDLSTVITDPGNAGHYTNAATFNESLASAVTFTTGAAVGTSMRFYSLSYTDFSQQSAIVEFAHSWTLSVDGTLIYDAALVGDTDSDGIVDASDNCYETANPAQVDSDGDGFGNACDTDLNNDCITNVVDLGIFRSVFFTTDMDADFNVDGVVNAVDLGIFRTRFLRPPGPSGVATCE